MLPVLLFACVVPQEGFIIGNAKAKVCILYYDSNFKKELVNRLGQDLNDKRISAYVDTMNNMINYNPDDYDAVILISGVVAGNPLPLTAEYIKKYNYKDNIIYFCAFFISKDAVYGGTLDHYSRFPGL
jgi:menaquinone-dependent protoporphyrinogen IX oxidase